MSRNGYNNNNGNAILVLYKIVNCEADAAGGLYNCFQMPYGSGPTLNSIKQHCVAAHSISQLGPDGFHWRVMMEDKNVAGAERTYSWWDIQDGNAKLPVKETSQYDLRKLLFPSKASSSSSSTTDTATKAAKGAFKMMGKAMASAIGEEGVETHGPPVSVIVVKLLDLMKIHDDINRKNGGGHGEPVVSQPRPRRAAPKSRPAAAAAAAPAARPTAAAAASRARPPAARQAPASAGTPQRQRRPPSAPAPAVDNLMDFGAAPAAAPAQRVLHHSSSMPAAPNPNETRAQRLKRQQEARMKNSNRVWDDVDQRWVEVDPKKGAAGAGAGAGAGAVAGAGAAAAARPKKKEVAVKLDMSNATGKSAHVQAAMQARVNEMNATRQKAVAEVKQREAAKKKMEDEEDAIRSQLEPKIKAWSEEHGKKKQLQALLASLHTILWQGAKWKQISIGDILQPAKVKKFYFKATLVVHPDKTRDLPADQRFLAKRIFDALTQAKTIWDEQNGK